MFDIFYIGKKGPGLFPHEQSVESIDQAQKISRTRYFWIVNYLSDYSEWDFLWEPVAWEKHFRHAWPSQWQKDNGTYLIPKTGYVETKYHTDKQIPRNKNSDGWESYDLDGFDYTWHHDITDPPYVYQFGTQWQKTGGPVYRVPDAIDTKYVSQITAKVKSTASGVITIDHMDGNIDHLKSCLPDLPVVKSSRYFDNYLDTLKRVILQLDDTHEFLWVCSSVCNYEDFDFSWHPEQWQSHMLQVFPSNDQKFGDTFFVYVPHFKKCIQDTELLEWFDCNFLDISVPRHPTPIVQYHTDTLVTAVKDTDLVAPITQFYRYPQQVAFDAPTVNLWRAKTKTVIGLSPDNSTALIPRDAKTKIESQIYDYEFINKTKRKTIDTVKQDIVYISYDETDAEKNYKILQQRFPNTKRVHGVQGMENALRKGAEVSDTPWYYAVFAKTQLAEDFVFDFVPDFFQSPKHYIFNCLNRVNGLEYGHMGIILYNCNMVIDAPPYEELGLDYTISFPVEVVPELSCYGNFDTSAYQTWRTSFRETAKLAYFENEKSTVENKHRLNVWQTRAEGEFAEWALNGARDGVEFFEESGGDLAYMKQSFDWNWLRERFIEKYGDLA
jgi:hypothetical protein